MVYTYIIITELAKGYFQKCSMLRVAIQDYEKMMSCVVKVS